jgi:hypothetical protein
MSGTNQGAKPPPPPPVDSPDPRRLDDSTERWIDGKTEAELLSDLKVYSARLRDDPRSIEDRLRVAAIQLRLRRVEEAMIHYEGVLRAYVERGQIGSAIALCRRLLNIYPDISRLQRILAALYARLPHGTGGSPTPVTPLDAESAGLIVEPEHADGGVVAERVFRRPNTGLHKIPTDRLLEEDDLQPTMRYASEAPDDGEPIPLTQRKQAARRRRGARKRTTSEEVVLLTRRKDS